MRSEFLYIQRQNTIILSLYYIQLNIGQKRIHITVCFIKFYTAGLDKTGNPRQPPDGLCQDDFYLFKVLLVASKKAITRNWLQEKCPTMDLLVSIVKQLHLLEQMTFSLRLQKEIGERRWEKWARYLNGVSESM